MQASRRLIGLLAIILFPGTSRPSRSNDSQQTQPAQAPVSQQAEEANNFLSPEAQEKLIRDIRRAHIMLPSYTVFDNPMFKVDGRTVTLEGEVTRPVLRDHAGRVVQLTEGGGRGHQQHRSAAARII